MILVDTDVLIHHLRGSAVATSWLAGRRREAPLTVSAVTVFEITGGMRPDEAKATWRVLHAFRVEPVTDVVARLAGGLRREFRQAHSGIGMGDYLIAATAELHGYELATLNVKHFPMLPELKPPFRA